jgi:hypothetical protein
MSGGIGQILYRLTDSEGRLIMDGPSDTVMIVLGIHPALLEACTQMGQTHHEHYDDRWGVITIKMLPVEVP